MGLHTHGIKLEGAVLAPSSDVTGLVAKITSLNTSGLSRDAIDISTTEGVQVEMVEQPWREFTPGMIDPGEISGTIRFDKTMLDQFIDSIEHDPETWTITFPDKGELANDSVFECVGFLTSACAITGEYESDLTADFTLKLTGEATFTPAHNP